jgi:hypothetical protein
LTSRPHKTGHFVLKGVTSPRTNASFVTCSIRPPSHAFQLRVMVTTTATASSTTNTGVPYFCQQGFQPGRS